MRLAKYGLTEDTYQAMLNRQGGGCAICGSKDFGSNQWGPMLPSIDHDHLTGQVRGLLCSRCNQALGYAKEDIFILESMIWYLKKDHSNASATATQTPAS